MAAATTAQQRRIGNGVADLSSVIDSLKQIEAMLAGSAASRVYLATAGACGPS